MRRRPSPASPARRGGNFLLWPWLLLALGAAPAQAHTVDDATPFHLVPEDYFTVTVGGGAFASPADVAVEAAPVGGGAATALVVVGVDASTTIGVRLPAAIALGEYEVMVAITGTPQTGPGPHIWVRERALRLIKKTVPKPFDYVNPGADFKEADLVDVDGDGALDVFAANSQSGGDVDMLFMNQTNVAAPACATPFCEQIATRMDRQAGLAFDRTYDADFVDLDADGDLDLVRTDNSSSSPLRIWENVGDGQFEERTIDAGPVVGFVDSLADIDTTVGMTAEMDFGDVNGDGRRDILLCPWHGPTVGLLLNEIPSTGKLRLLDLGCGGGSPSALCDTEPTANRGCAFGDFDNDGQLDIIAPIYGGGQPLVFLHTGDVNTGHPSDDPQFSAHSDWVKDAGGANLSMHGGDLKVADLDGDGDDDVALGSPAQGGTEHAYVLWNDGGTALRAIDPEPSPFVGDAYDVAFSDLDADGDLDVVFANEFTSNDNRVLINHGGVDGDLLFLEYTSPDSIWYEE
ncbi:MAG: VCBS repeat-containing protein, partial [Chloroflexi bacterium]|nr:VCBS repeat-containing protein [Chloroflexota bacterium]